MSSNKSDSQSLSAMPSASISLEARMKYISECKKLQNYAKNLFNSKTPEYLLLLDNFPFCDESIKYEKVAKIGQGTFG
jgi:hypothetical protein